MRPAALRFLALLLLAAGCGKAPAPEVVTEHRAQPPHGGTAVPLGDGHYQVELVLDRAAGRLQAYVLDDELENFVPASSPTLALTATAAGSQTELVLAAVANSLTGETVGATSLFEVTSAWLQAHPQFDGTLGPLTVRGAAQPPAKFHFPAP